MSTLILTALMLFTFACLIPTAFLILYGKMEDSDSWIALSVFPCILIAFSVGLILATFNIF